MKKIAIFILCGIFLTNSKSQDIPKNPVTVLDVLEAKKQKLFDVAFANQDTLQQLAKKKPKTVIVEKIRYIKIYRTVPIYVPENDSGKYRSMFPDTVENDYFISPKFGVPPTPPQKKKTDIGKFLYNIFH